MDNTKRLHQLLHGFYFQIANFVTVYNLSSTRHSNYENKQHMNKHAEVEEKDSYLDLFVLRKECGAPFVQNC